MKLVHIPFFPMEKQCQQVVPGEENKEQRSVAVAKASKTFKRQLLDVLLEEEEVEDIKELEVRRAVFASAIKTLGAERDSLETEILTRRAAVAEAAAMAACLEQAGARRDVVVFLGNTQHFPGVDMALYQETRVEVDVTCGCEFDGREVAWPRDVVSVKRVLVRNGASAVLLAYISKELSACLAEACTPDALGALCTQRSFRITRVDRATPRSGKSTITVLVTLLVRRCVAATNPVTMSFPLGMDATRIDMVSESKVLVRGSAFGEDRLALIDLSVGRVLWETALSPAEWARRPSHPFPVLYEVRDEFTIVTTNHHSGFVRSLSLASSSLDATFMYKQTVMFDAMRLTPAGDVVGLRNGAPATVTLMTGAAVTTSSDVVLPPGNLVRQMELVGRDGADVVRLALRRCEGAPVSWTLRTTTGVVTPDDECPLTMDVPPASSPFSVHAPCCSRGFLVWKEGKHVATPAFDSVAVELLATAVGKSTSIVINEVVFLIDLEKLCALKNE